MTELGVVIPARNEQLLLPSCLSAIAAAGRHPALVRVRVTVVVVADSCTDATAEIARRHGVQTIEVSAHNVGAARAAGCAQLLRGAAPDRLWLATTDADTVVPPHWLARQLSHRAEGWDAVVGTVTVDAGCAAATRRAFTGAYRAALSRRSHPHVHGANLGVSAAAYLAAGGFRALVAAEDHALVRTLTTRGRRVLRAPDLTVTTSGRSRGRAPGGFSDYLRRLPAG